MFEREKKIIPIKQENRKKIVEIVEINKCKTE